MKKLSTIHDIARELNITASTVSRALKDNPRISAETRREVQRVAKKLNYQPNHIAAALRSGRSKIIGIIVPNVDRGFFSSVVFGIEEVATKAGYNVMICQSHESYEKEVTTIEALLNAQVDGVIASFAKETVDFSHFEKLKQNRIPLIFFDRANPDLGVSQVVTDDYLGAYKATEHLIQQGCKNIAHFTSHKNVSIFKERFRGYRDAIEAYNLPYFDKLVIKSDLQLEDGQQIMQNLIDQKVKVDAVFSSSAFGAMGALQVCKKNKVSVPDQVAIVGFSNELFASFSDPTLTSVEQHSLQMGRVAAEMFFDQINGGQLNGEFAPKKMVLSPTLIVRESTLRNK